MGKCQGERDERWGAGNRSMPYSLLQLLGRPGYFIGDYLSGKRQVSYPPVRMLLIVAVISLIIDHLLTPDAVTTGEVEHDLYLTDYLSEWLENNPGWSMMIICALLILPTWFLFRFSPRFPKHTLPEGFFLQVFMSTIILIIFILNGLIDADWVNILVIVYYIVAYHQLFGYGLWGTLWRLVLVFCEGVVILLTFSFLVEFAITRAPVNPEHTIGHEIVSLVILNAISVAFLGVAYFIGRHGYHKRLKKENNTTIINE